MKLSVLIPVYNEEGTVEETIRRVQAVDAGMEKELIVIDDGSTDSTLKKLEALAGPDLKIVVHNQNKGKGASIKTGLEEANGDIVIIQDADLEYYPEEYPQLLAPIVKDGAAVVYGSRFLGEIEAMRWVNFIANKILVFLVNWLFDGRISDEATCYKVFRTEVLRNLGLRACGFDFCPEVTAKLLKRGYKITEVPIHYKARQVGKKIGWWDGILAIYTLFKYRFWG